MKKYVLVALFNSLITIILSAQSVKELEYNLSIENAALQLNHSDKTALLSIATIYYKDFIYPLEREEESIIFDDSLFQNDVSEKKSVFEHSADSALVYLYKLWDLNTNLRETIYYPIRQLECYLNKCESSPIPKEAEQTFEQCFFPATRFINLKENWPCDMTIDYLFNMSSAIHQAEWVKTQLFDLQEKCIYNSELPANGIVYRFTWLRSFEHPVCIRIEKIEDRAVLYWKIGKGAGGYAPKGLKKSCKKRLNNKEWEAFQNLLKEADFDNLPNECEISMADGEDWILEKKTNSNFKMHRTNWPSKEFENACLYILKKTDVKIRKEDE